MKVGTRKRGSGYARGLFTGGISRQTIFGGSFVLHPCRPKDSENSKRLWPFLGSVRGFSRKTPGKSRENCRIILPESRSATNSRILGTGKGKPAGNLGATLPGSCAHLPCGILFEIDSSSLLEFF